ncbi:MAG: DEAD/DEAH box helicase family protein, partial [Clostridia bacterium]|nr:DEAD/DEAH box helicase family protein [Clostridia bacterium]
MSIDLFKHNDEAYKSVVTMLKKTGKAAVVHPTGTGKSFIGFKLCEDNPGKRICWLSPSEYIFKTQLENLRKCSDGFVPENITFFTYAKLMNVSKTELEELKLDYIIFDEFHRCGAQMWGDGVNRLLEIYPDTPIVGLSATAIRYLDNQRNMADELFDGCIASDMTLGEAIVRGILAPPKYVLAVFAYEAQLKRYEKRVRAAKSNAVREEGQKYLDALRRTLEKADGIDAIFEKHITDPCGKYIVFCADYRHLCDMAELAKDWFKNIDSEPHVYKAYSDDPDTDASFEAFKKDSSNHIKLLFCIDMLNEGVHVEDISGVILLRPTVSPIVYKQQIGRALAAGKNESAVIFDIVLNIDNLYCIDAIEEEMQIATSY